MILSTNKTTDPNKFLPIRYPWARKCYKDESANHWVPESIPMGEDATQWKTGKLTEAEKQMVLMNVGFFSTAESLTANNIVLAAYRHVSDPACRQYMLRQAYTEAIHTDTFVYCCDTLGLSPDEVYDAYLKIESIKEKDDFVLDITKTIFDPSFQIHEDDPETIRKFLFDLIGFYVLMEGIFFYAGFCMMLGLKRRNLMVGLGEQFDYILRDESVHLSFGNYLIHTIKNEYPQCWTKDFEERVIEAIRTAVRLEQVYAREACPPGISGMNANQICQYVEYIADRRLQRLGLPMLYNMSNPFPWMETSLDLQQRKNFFETKVTDYQTGTLEW